jgi:hypothetical protein
MYPRRKRFSRGAPACELGGLAVQAGPEILVERGERDLTPGGCDRRTVCARLPTAGWLVLGERRDPTENEQSSVPRDGIEPPTRGFSILCSTD